MRVRQALNRAAVYFGLRDEAAAALETTDLHLLGASLASWSTLMLWFTTVQAVALLIFDRDAARLVAEMAAGAVAWGVLHHYVYIRGQLPPREPTQPPTDAAWEPADSMRYKPRAWVTASRPGSDWRGSSTC